MTRGLKQTGTAEATSNGIVETEGVRQIRPPASKASASRMSCSMDVNVLWIRDFFFSFKCKKTPALSGSSQSRPALEKTVPSSLIEKALIRPIFVQMKPRRCCEQLLAARAPCPERDNQREALFYPAVCKATGIVVGGDGGRRGGGDMSLADVILTVDWKESLNCSSCMERQRTRMGGQKRGIVGVGGWGVGWGWCRVGWGGCWAWCFYASGWKCATINHVQPSASWPVHKAP